MSTQQSSAARPFRRGFYWTSIGSVVAIVALFVETLIAVRLLESRASFGIYVLLTAFVNFLIVVVDLGGTTAITQMIVSSDHTRHSVLVHNALVLRILIIASCAGVIWFGRNLPFLVDAELMHYVAYVPLMLMVASLDELLLGMLQGFGAYRHMTVARIVRSVGRLVLTAVLLGVFHLGLVGLVYSWVVSFALSIAYQYFVLPVSKRLGCQRAVLVELLKFGMPLHGNRFLSLALRRLDVLLLGAFLPATSVAYFGVASRIPDAVRRFSESYIAVYFPTIAALVAAGKHDEASRMLNQSMRLISFAMALVVIGSVIFSQEIIGLLFTTDYLPSSAVFATLMIALHMGLMLTVMGYTLTSAGYPARSFTVNSFRTVLHILSNLVLIPTVGFIGPAYASFISSYAATPLSGWLLRRSEIAVNMSLLFKQLLILLLCAALFWWLQPTVLLYKLAIVGLFVALNALLLTISRDDFSLVLPERMLKRLA